MALESATAGIFNEQPEQPKQTPDSLRLENSLIEK